MDYDSARHHYESLQTAKKKDEAKIAKVGLAVVAAGGESLGVSAGGLPPVLVHHPLCRLVTAPWWAGVLGPLCSGIHSR